MFQIRRMVVQNKSVEMQKLCNQINVNLIGFVTKNLYFSNVTCASGSVIKAEYKCKFEQRKHAETHIVRDNRKAMDRSLNIRMEQELLKLVTNFT